MLHQIKIIDIQGYEFQGLILQQDLSVAKLLAMALCKVVKYQVRQILRH